MATGTITLNGINDATLIKILEIKTRHEKEMSFQPNALQTVTQPAQRAGMPAIPVVPQQYNNAILAWNGLSGLSGVIEILQHIHSHKHEQS
jgi:hypothetical protein